MKGSGRCLEESKNDPAYLGRNSGQDGGRDSVAVARIDVKL